MTPQPLLLTHARAAHPDVLPVLASVQPLTAHSTFLGPAAATGAAARLDAWCFPSLRALYGAHLVPWSGLTATATASRADS